MHICVYELHGMLFCLNICVGQVADVPVEIVKESHKDGAILKNLLVSQLYYICFSLTFLLLMITLQANTSMERDKHKK